MNKTKGFTLVELIVAMAISLIVIAVAGSFIITGTNLLGQEANSARRQDIADNAANFIRDRLLYAESIEVSGTPPSLPPPAGASYSLIYVGEDANATSEGRLYFKRADVDDAIDVYGEAFYGNSKIALEYSADVSIDTQSGGLVRPKIVSIAVSVINSDGTKGYTTTKTFQLINSTNPEKEPSSSVMPTGAYYLIIYGAQQ